MVSVYVERGLDLFGSGWEIAASFMNSKEAADYIQ
jgi:hypothetical protein